MHRETTINTKSYNYPEYRKMIFDLAEKKRTTGPEQSSERIEATKLNAQRIKRLDKTITIDENLASEIRTIDKNWKWTVLLESWCGDGAQNIPVIAMMASLNNRIELQLLLRDENPEIMDQHLTNGTRSIPILICSDEKTGMEIGIWGPRPRQIIELMNKYKVENPKTPHSDFIKNLHLCYARDNGQSIQKDFLFLIRSWKNKPIRY